MRVVLASERPQVQNLLMDVVEEEPGAVVVGQADNATKAFVMVKNLRPDIAIIDSNLPYAVGLDAVTLSRMSGLDAAQTICQTISGTRVVVISNLDRQFLPAPGFNTDARAFLSVTGIEGSNALKLGELHHKTMLPSALVFANVAVKSPLDSTQENDQVTEREIAFGVVSVAGGLYLIGTLWLAPYGVLLMLVGVVTLGFGLVKRLFARLWRRER